jgi:hypothetical protein
MSPSPPLCIHLGRTRYSYNPGNMRCSVRLLAFHITTNLVEYSFGRTKAQVRKNEDRPYIFRKTQHKTPRGKGRKESEKKKSVPALNTVDRPSTSFLEFRGLEEVEEMSNEIGWQKSTSRGDGLISLRLLQPPTFSSPPDLLRHPSSELQEILCACPLFSTRLLWSNSNCPSLGHVLRKRTISLCLGSRHNHVLSKVIFWVPRANLVL